MEGRQSLLAANDLPRMPENSQPAGAKGTALILSSDPKNAPDALLRNLKSNKVLHQRTNTQMIETLDVPSVCDH